MIETDKSNLLTHPFEAELQGVGRFPPMEETAAERGIRAQLQAAMEADAAFCNENKITSPGDYLFTKAVMSSLDTTEVAQTFLIELSEPLEEVTQKVRDNPLYQETHKAVGRALASAIDSDEFEKLCAGVLAPFLVLEKLAVSLNRGRFSPQFRAGSVMLPLAGAVVSCTTESPNPPAEVQPAEDQDSPRNPQVTLTPEETKVTPPVTPVATETSAPHNEQIFTPPDPAEYPQTAEAFTPVPVNRDLEEFVQSVSTEPEIQDAFREEVANLTHFYTEVLAQSGIDNATIGSVYNPDTQTFNLVAVTGEGNLVQLQYRNAAGAYIHVASFPSPDLDLSNTADFQATILEGVDTVFADASGYFVFGQRDDATGMVRAYFRIADGVLVVNPAYLQYTLEALGIEPDPTLEWVLDETGVLYALNPKDDVVYEEDPETGVIEYVGGEEVPEYLEEYVQFMNEYVGHPAGELYPEEIVFPGSSEPQEVFSFWYGKLIITSRPHQTPDGEPLILVPNETFQRNHHEAHAAEGAVVLARILQKSKIVPDGTFYDQFASDNNNLERMFGALQEYAKENPVVKIGSLEKVNLQLPIQIVVEVEEPPIVVYPEPQGLALTKGGEPYGSVFITTGEDGRLLVFLKEEPTHIREDEWFSPPFEAMMDLQSYGPDAPDIPVEDSTGGAAGLRELFKLMYDEKYRLSKNWKPASLYVN